MRSPAGSRPLAAFLVLLLVLVAGLSGPGSFVLAQEGSPVSEQPVEEPVQEEPPAEVPTETPVPEPPTEVPVIPTDVPTIEPTVPLVVDSPTEVPVEPAADVTLTLGSAPCYSPASFWQVFVTMDAYQFPATATLNFVSGGSATVTYQQSSTINGRAYGLFNWNSNLSDSFASITGAFPANLNPRVESVTAPACGPATVTPTATNTATSTATATFTATSTPTVSNITLTPGPGVCSSGLNFWQIFVTMDQSQFPATATLNFSNGGSATVAYQQSSYINGRYYGYFIWSGNVSDEFVSITGQFPANLNPAIYSVSGPNCGPATITATASATATPAATTLSAVYSACTYSATTWTVAFKSAQNSFPSTITLNFTGGATGTGTYNGASFGSEWTGEYVSGDQLAGDLESISVVLPSGMTATSSAIVRTGPNCGAPAETATATATATLTPTNSNVTLTPDFTNCQPGNPYGWLVYINMDTDQTPSMLTYMFKSGATVNVWQLYSGNSAENRYWASYSSFDYPNDVLESVTGIIPSGTNPVALVYGAPNTCPSVETATETATATATASNTPENTATATSTATTADTETATATASSTATTATTATGTATGTATTTATNTATVTNTPLPTIVTSANVNCRVGPSTSTASLGVVPKGTSVPVRGAVQNGWTPVICFGQDGWISSSYAPTPTATPTLIPLQGVAFMQSTTNCFVSPSLSSTVIGSVNANARIPLRGGLQNGWYPVVCLGQDGWVLGSYVAVQTATPTRTATVTQTSTPSQTSTATQTATVTNTATETTTPSQTATGTATSTATQTATVTSTPLATVVISANVNCRVGPSTSASILGVVAKGTALGVRGAAQNGWTPVICFDQDGWISSSYAPTATPTRTATRTVTATRTPSLTPTFIPVTGSAYLKSHTNCFAQPSLSSAVVGSINRNAVIPLLGGLQNGWYPVICNGQQSWILGAYITVVTPTATATASLTPTVTQTVPAGSVVVTTARVNCRSGANTRATVIVVLDKGVSVPLRGAATGGWTPVVCGGQDGWISSSYAPTATATATTTSSFGSVITTTAVNCRASGSGAGTIITVVPGDTILPVRGATSNIWVPVVCGGQDGWISIQYLRFL